MVDISDLVDAISSRERVSGLTHGLYRYPARFSPGFARAAISAFTKPGDLVLDPFVGGGTSAVESLALGRRVAGTDLNELAVFVSRAKTTLLSPTEASRVLAWAEDLDRETSQAWHTAIGARDSKLDHRVPWNVRRSLDLALALVEQLEGDRVRRIARATLLALGQWSLDGRRYVPTRRQMLAKHRDIVAEAIRGNERLCEATTRAFGLTLREVEQHCCIRHSPAQDLAKGTVIPASWDTPKLVLTSPPYHGVHILYHRWQVEGRRETNAPYWVSGCNDGQPASYYTFGARNKGASASLREDYFESALSSFRAIHKVCDDTTTVVQLVGFSNPETQLSRYLWMMGQAGFREARDLKNVSGITRQVPNRKWYMEAQGRVVSSEKEYLLIHRRAN